MLITDSLIYKIEAENVYQFSTNMKTYLTSVSTQKIENIITIQMIYSHAKLKKKHVVCP